MPATHDSFVNFGSTTLAGGAGGAGTALNPSDTSMTVNDTSKVPSVAPFPLLLTSGASNEIVKCVNVAGGVYTIVRAQEGTAALTFGVGSTVANEFTAGSVTNLYTRIQEWPFNIRDYGAVADGVVDYNGVATGLTTPAAPTLATATTGGTVAAGTYQVEVSLVNALGETAGSASASVVTTGSTSTITITSPISQNGATGWYAYVTQAGGATYTRQQTAGSPTALGTNLVLTAPPTSSGANPPGTNTTGSTTLTTTTSPGPFTSAMTGRSVLVRGAGVSGGDLWATATYVSATQLTLSVAASATVSGATLYVLTTDDYPALTAVMAAVSAAGGGEILIPAGVYLINCVNSGNGAQFTPVNGGVTVRGAGQQNTILVGAGGVATAASAFFSAVAGASITVQDLTLVAPPNPNGQPTRGVWQQGTAGKAALRRVNAWNFSTGLQVDNGATIEVVVEDCDLSTHPLTNLGGATVVVQDAGRFEMFGCYVHDFGVAGSNQNHGIYIHQGVDKVIADSRFGANRGIGWGVKDFNGTGSAASVSYDNLTFEPGSYLGILACPTVRSKITNCRFVTASSGVTIQTDADIRDCQFDGITAANYYITQASGTTASKVSISNCWFDTPAVTGTFPLRLNIAGSIWRITNCDMTCNQANAMFNSGGGVYILNNCSFADDAIGHLIVTGGAAPALSLPATNVGTTSVTGNDIRGMIQFTVSTSAIAAGTALFTITFATAYGATPVVLVSNQTGNLVAGDFSVSAVGAASFVVRNNVSLPVAAAYQVAYHVLG